MIMLQNFAIKIQDNNPSKANDDPSLRAIVDLFQPKHPWMTRNKLEKFLKKACKSFHSKEGLTTPTRKKKAKSKTAFHEVTPCMFDIFIYLFI